MEAARKAGATPASRLLSIVTKHPFEKVLAAACAIALYLYMRDQIEMQDKIAFRVEDTVDVSHDHVIVYPQIEGMIVLPDPASRSVTIEVNGPSAAVQGLRDRKIRLRVPAAKLEAGLPQGDDDEWVAVSMSDLERRDRRLTEVNMRFENDRPLRFRVSRVESRTLPVEFEFNHKHPDPENYRFGTPEVRPSQVEVRAPTWWFSENTSVKLDAHPVPGVPTQDEYFAGRLTDEATEAGVSLVGEVDVRIPVHPTPTTKVVRARVHFSMPPDMSLGEAMAGRKLEELFSIGLNKGYDDTDGTIPITLEGPEMVMRQYRIELEEQPGLFFVELEPADLEETTPFYRTLRVRDGLPEGIVLKEPKDGQIQVSPPGPPESEN